VGAALGASRTTALHDAVRLRCSPALLAALVAAGADPYALEVGTRATSPIGLVCRRAGGPAGAGFAAGAAAVAALLGLESQDDATCPICCEALVAQRMACGHAFCARCLESFMAAFVADGGTFGTLRCPAAPACSHTMTYREANVALRGRPDILTRLEMFTRDAALLLMPGFQWCARCTYGGVVVGLGRGCTSVTCPVCETAWCSLCRTRHDAAAPCAADGTAAGASVAGGGDAAMTGDLSRAWVRSNTKPCPKCAVPITRSSGCSHMTCRVCAFQFCWLCLNSYLPGTYVHSDTCNCARRRAELGLPPTDTAEGRIVARLATLGLMAGSEGGGGSGGGGGRKLGDVLVVDVAVEVGEAGGGAVVIAVGE
jgi:hypothetical protein